MSFYKFKQNNSGGGFDLDDKVTIAVWIEADTPSQANSKAEEIGIYFNGCDDGTDCECCGDRWYEVSERDAEDEPTTSKYDDFWVRNGVAHTYIYYANGKKEEWIKEDGDE